MAATSAELIDKVCGPDSATPAYARTAALRTHTTIVAEFAGRVSMAPADPDDPWERIAQALTANPDEWPASEPERP